MTIRRLTISVRESVAKRIKKAAKGASVSAWITAAIEDRLEDADLERLWEEFYESVAPRTADVRRADALFERLTKTPSRKGAA